MIRVVLDMNLGPRWVTALSAEGIDALHWSSVGRLDADDGVIFAWAGAEDRIILTCDLDFTQILAVSGAGKPSVVILRAPDVTAAAMARSVAGVLRTHEITLKQGALIIIDAARSRVRILPIRSG